MTDLTTVIQAGGKSSRMGHDKALVPFMGVTMIEYILEQVKEVGRETIIITNRQDGYRFLGLPLYPDVIPHLGALGGLYSAIYHAPQDACLVLACDMPFINRPLLEHIIALLPNFDAVIPRLDPAGNGIPVFAEPFRAVYHKSCLAPIKAAIDAKQRRVISFFDQVNIRFVDLDEIKQFDPGLRSFFNVNTPDDLVNAERMAEDG
jgi:molybdenum cofactor guanylyltransferase